MEDIKNLPLALFFIEPARERLDRLFDCLEARGVEVRLHRLGKDSKASDLEAAYQGCNLKLVVLPRHIGNGAMYGVTDDFFEYVKKVQDSGVVVLRVEMDLGGPFDDEIEIMGDPKVIAAGMLKAMGLT